MDGLHLWTNIVYIWQSLLVLQNLVTSVLRLRIVFHTILLKLLGEKEDVAACFSLMQSWSPQRRIRHTPHAVRRYGDLRILRRLHRCPIHPYALPILCRPTSSP